MDKLKKYDIEVKGTDMGYDCVESAEGSFYLVRDVKAELTKANERIEDLKDFTDHSISCKNSEYRGRGTACTCGLDKLLKGK